MPFETGRQHLPYTLESRISFAQVLTLNQKNLDALRRHMIVQDLRHGADCLKRPYRVASGTLLGEPVGHDFLCRQAVAYASTRATSTPQFAQNGSNIPL